jgi:hypothetical protein
MHRNTFVTTLAAAALSIGLGGCGAKEPTQTVEFGDGNLQIELAESWIESGRGDREMSFRHPQVPGAELRLEQRSEDTGAFALTVPAVKSQIGSHYNRKYGVTSRMTLPGNALITFDRELEEGGDWYFQRQWIVATPRNGSGYVLRVDATLRVPLDQAKAESTLGLAEGIDTALGDAEFALASRT